MISPEQEREYIRQAQSGDEDALLALLEENKRYSRRCTKPQKAANLSWAKILYELIATGDTLETIGNRLCISRQRVHEILKMAKYHKIPVHPSRYPTNQQTPQM